MRKNKSAMNIVEEEILRAKYYYETYEWLANELKEYGEKINYMPDIIFNKNDGYYTKIRLILIRWLFILIRYRHTIDIKALNEVDDLFISVDAPDLIKQIRVDLTAYFNKEPPEEYCVDIHDRIKAKFKEYARLIKSTKKLPDNAISVTYTNRYPILYYVSDSVSNLPDDKTVSKLYDCIRINYYSDRKYLSRNLLVYTFVMYFRYKYIYTDNQTLAYSYKSDKEKAIECFSTPFNHHHNYFCSAFPLIERHLGSQGEFFDLMVKILKNKYEFPVNDLKINPVFDEMVDYRVSEAVINFMNHVDKLPIKKKEEIKNKYGTDKLYYISMILPDWKNFEAVDMLIEQKKYLVKVERYKKRELYFNNFFTNKTIPPCDIIIIYLEV